MNIEKCREKFEEITMSNFGIAPESYRRLRDKNGCYNDAILEDHWNTFQEGWEEAMEFMKETK